MSGIRVNYSGLVSFIVGISSIFIAIGFSLIVTRSLSPEQYGTWGVISGILIYAVIFDSVVGFWALRDTARKKDSKKTAIFSNGLFSIAGILIYIVSGLIISPLSEIDLQIILFAIILIPIRYFQKTLTSINMGWKPEVASYSNICAEIIKIPIALFLIYFLEMGIFGVILTLFISHISAIIIQSIYLRGKISSSFSKEDLSKWFKLSWIPIYPKLSLLLYRSDVIVFPIITGSIIGVAYFSASMVIAGIVGYAGAISSSVYGKLLETNETGYLRKNVSLLFYFIIPLIGIAAAFSRPGLFALNPQYESAWIAAILLSIQTLFFTLNGIFSSFILGVEKVDENKNSSTKDYLKSNMFKLPSIHLIQYSIYVILLSIVLWVFLEKSDIELVNIWAGITVLIQIPITFYFYYLIKKQFDFKFEKKRISMFIFIAITVFALSFILSEEFLSYNENVFVFIPNLLIFIIIPISLYFIVTYFVDNEIKNLVKTIITQIKNSS